MDLNSYLAAVATLLNLPPLEAGQQGAFSVQFAEGRKVNVEVADWPAIRLYRSVALALHGDEARVYLALLEWNKQSPGPVLAMDEGGALYLVQSIDAEEIEPQGLAEAMAAFSQWGMAVQERLDALQAGAAATSSADVARVTKRDDESAEEPPLFDTRMLA